MNMKKEILVTGYINPDLDGFACIFTYADFLNKTGKKAVASVAGQHHEEADHVLSEYNLKFKIKDENPKNFQKIVLVDASDLDGIDKRINPENVIQIIDHRKINMSESFPNAQVQIELVGAAATLIAEKYRDNNLSIPKNIATLIYGAIISNTLNFQAKVTTERDKTVTKWLKKENNFPNNFAHKMFLAKSDVSGAKLTKMIRGDFANFKSHNFNNKQVGIAQIEMIEGQKMVKERKGEIVSEIKKIMHELSLDIVFLTVIDLEDRQNILIAPNKEIEKLLEKILNIKFADQIAIRPGLIMRKEIVPLIKEELTKS